MTGLKARRTFGITLLLLVAAGYFWLDYALKTSFQLAAQISGYLLFGLCLFLTFFNARKKLPFIPLLRASTWMQIHIYVGYFVMFLGCLHAGFRLPTGGLEITVAVLFALVSLSGVVGLILTRVLPARLTVHGENLVFERIPGMRSKLRDEVENLVVKSAETTESSTIADFYRQNLADYFGQPMHCGSHLFGSAKPLHHMLEQIASLGRYLDENERQVMDELSDHVRAKNNLDFQWYAQGTLKVWLFIHIPLTFALLLFAATHGILATKFT
ncbi:MAG: hypothetical protein ACPGVU_03575 [Limisphaerales bacterium]